MKIVYSTFSLVSFLLLFRRTKIMLHGGNHLVIKSTLPNFEVIKVTLNFPDVADRIKIKGLRSSARQLHFSGTVVNAKIVYKTLRVSSQHESGIVHGLSRQRIIFVIRLATY